MTTSLFIARILGPACVITAAGIFLNRRTYQAVFDDFLKSPALIYLGGVIALVIGLCVVLLHNVWTADWRVIITIYGWGGVIKGTWLLLFPAHVGKFMQIYQKNNLVFAVHIGIVLAIGLTLTLISYY